MSELPGQTSHSYHILVLIKGERIWHHVLGYVQNSLFPLFKKIWNHLSKITGIYTLSRCGCCCLITELCLTLPQPTDCSHPGLSFQAGILERVAISFSRGPSWPRDQTSISCIGRRILYHWATREAYQILLNAKAALFLSPQKTIFA